MVSGATRHSDGVLSALKFNEMWGRFLVKICGLDMKSAQSFMEHIHAIASLSMNQAGSSFTPTRKSSKEEACRAFCTFMTSKLPFSLRNPSSLAAGTTVILNVVSDCESDVHLHMLCLVCCPLMDFDGLFQQVFFWLIWQFHFRQRIAPFSWGSISCCHFTKANTCRPSEWQQIKHNEPTRPSTSFVFSLRVVLDLLVLKCLHRRSVHCCEVRVMCL